MEMVQFHPTGLLVGDSGVSGTVLEEGLRGVGGHLFNGRLERYMEKYDPVRLERSTRDVVSRVPIWRSSPVVAARMAASTSMCPTSGLASSNTISPAWWSAAATWGSTSPVSQWGSPHGPLSDGWCEDRYRVSQ